MNVMGVSLNIQIFIKRIVMKRIIISIVIGLMAVMFMPSVAAAQSYKWADGKPSLDFADKAADILTKSSKSSSFLKKLYKAMYETPIWVSDKGLTTFGVELIKSISTDPTVPPTIAKGEMLAKVKKEIADLKSKQGGTLQDKIALELDMSRLYKSYVDYLIYGGINWSSFKSKLANLKEAKKADFGWVVYRPSQTPISVLQNAIDSGSLKDGFRSAEPTRFNYARLKRYLSKYIKLQRSGKWKSLPKFSGKIKAGQSNRAIPAIKNNLKLTGDFGNCQTDVNSPAYDGCTQKAVKHFQARNGLSTDGVIGRGTYNKLAMPISKKIQLIRMNLDRIKRFRHDSESVRIELNIPSFRLNVFDKNKLVDTIRVITGKPNHPTPVFGSKVQYIVVNPWWKIPESIVKKEMLRHLIQDPYYYERRGKVLHATWDEHSERIDPGTVNWSRYKSDSAHIPYRFMQVPSIHNALGKIKFIFPNRFSVYIHDTPSKSLFFRSRRAYSHGCMRIQKPRELLEVFSTYNSNIDVQEVMDRLQGTEKEILPLKHKIPVDITYLTAYVDPYGYLNFRDDIYHYDKYTLKDYKFKVDKYHKVSSGKKRNSKGKKSKDDYQISEVYPQ